VKSNGDGGVVGGGGDKFENSKVLQDISLPVHPKFYLCLVE
jgi:hypothetical protein